jgi:hypothetical protein
VWRFPRATIFSIETSGHSNRLDASSVSSFYKAFA